MTSRRVKVSKAESSPGEAFQNPSDTHALTRLAEIFAGQTTPAGGAR
jgi:hypothetical protein